MPHIAERPNAADRRTLLRVDDAWHGIMKGTLPLDPDGAWYDPELALAVFVMRAVAAHSSEPRGRTPAGGGHVLDDAEVNLRVAQALEVLFYGKVS